MKILIIGNGFDVAHGLPTRYTDFLERTKEFFDYQNHTSLDSVLGKLFNDSLTQMNLHNEFCTVENNVWLKYFIKQQENNLLKGDTWIDFEHEIRDVILIFERVGITYPEEIIHDDIQTQIQQVFFITKFNDWLTNLEEAKKEIPFDGNRITVFSEFMFSHLKKFTRAFEIYCLCVINKVVLEFSEKHDVTNLYNDINISIDNLNALGQKMIRIKEQVALNTHFPKAYGNADLASQKNELQSIEADINHAKNNQGTLINKSYSTCLLKKYDFDAVLSFNYTNTFETLYANEKTKFCYLHGKAQNEVDKTNMILGINDTLKGEDADTLFVFAQFKKYFQRIINKTGSEYKDWISTLENSKSTTHEIYILGHSLGLTDRDVLKEFFEVGQNQNNVKITVLYHDEIAKIRAVEKVIELIGKDNLIRRVHGSDWNIRFINQYDEKLGIIKRLSEMEHSI